MHLSTSARTRCRAELDRPYRIGVLKRPAKIAYDVELAPDLDSASEEAIRRRILEVLSA